MERLRLTIGVGQNSYDIGPKRGNHEFVAAQIEGTKACTFAGIETQSSLFNFHPATVAKDRPPVAIGETALRGENIDMLHVIGPQTAHKIHPDSLIEIERRLAEIASVGRAKMPIEVHYTTWMLRYNRQYWLTVDELQEHWVRTRIHAKLTSQTAATIKTQNVKALTIDWPAGQCPLSLLLKPTLEIDGQQGLRR